MRQKIMILVTMISIFVCGCGKEVSPTIESDIEPTSTEMSTIEEESDTTVDSSTVEESAIEESTTTEESQVEELEDNQDEIYLTKEYNGFCFDYYEAYELVEINDTTLSLVLEDTKAFINVTTIEMPESVLTSDATEEQIMEMTFDSVAGSFQCEEIEKAFVDINGKTAISASCRGVVKEVETDINMITVLVGNSVYQVLYVCLPDAEDSALYDSEYEIFYNSIRFIED